MVRCRLLVVVVVVVAVARCNRLGTFFSLMTRMSPKVSFLSRHEGKVVVELLESEAPTENRAQLHVSLKFLYLV